MNADDRHSNIRLLLRPCELKDANKFVENYHRHHKPCVGHRFSLKVVDEAVPEFTYGVAIVGRPVARLTDFSSVLEVTRLCCFSVPNVCSMLYSGAARVAKELGYQKIQTFVLESEGAGSLRASGWKFDGESAGGPGFTRRGLDVRTNHTT